MARRLAWVCLGGLAAVRPAVADPPPVPPPAQLAASDDLALAAACLGRGEDATAIEHLSRHLAVHPDRSLVRFSLAEVLGRCGRFAHAGAEYERFIHDTPPRPELISRLLQAHTRIVTLANQAGDTYAEHLHRGVGLYLVAGLDDVEAEALLCKAAGELTIAARERPTEPRPHWYLYLVWQKLGQSQPAERQLHQAVELASHDGLSPHERRDLAAVPMPSP
jgi:Tfp pilus assembly protein PilF